jgi:predicted Ser/Thr protein kinase
MHVNVERLLCETPLSVEPSSLEAIHQRLFGSAKRRAPDCYEIHEELGRGGFGRVYRSTDKRYPREVALKVIPYHGARQLARLEREARALAGLAHPNIVTVFDKGIADAGIYFLAIERVTGTRLDEWMHEPARRLDEIVEIFAQAAEGLQHAHLRGMTHRDFKPSNAIVDEDGRLRILDFGLVEIAGEVETATEGSAAGPEQDDSLASAASYIDPTCSSDWSHGDGAAAQHAEGSRVPGFRGTLAYASPEQLEGSKEVDERTDQFSLCVALFEACHGFRPFSGRTVLELSEQMTTGKLARGRSRRRIPRWLERLLRRGLSPNPAERYEHVGEIAAILRAHLRPKPWLAVAAGVALTLGLAGFTAAAMRPPTIDLDWSGAWPEGTDQAWVGATYGPGLSNSLATYEHDWELARDQYARDPEREADGAPVRCLEQAKQRFRTFVEGLQEPTPRMVPASIASERIWLAHVANPKDCLRSEHRWATNDALAQQIVDAQAARLAGRYEEALERLAAARDEPVFQRGRASGLFHYELGLVQLRLWDQEAWLTLAAASQDTGEDRELLVEVLAQQLAAGVLLQAAEPGEIDTLLSLLRRRTAEVESVEAAHPIVVLAEGLSLFQRGLHREAKRSVAEAREAFAALAPSPYRDLMIAHCTLTEAYYESNEEQPHIDFEAVEPALAVLGASVGKGHPTYLRNAIRVARMMVGDRHLDPAEQLLAGVVTKLDPGPGQRPSFDLLRAQAALLYLDLERHDYGEGQDPAVRTRKATEWTAKALELGTQLDALSLEPAQQKEAAIVREILLAARSVAGEGSSAK